MGSLFKARDYWSWKFDAEEEVDARSMCYANIDNERGGADKLIIGSFQGVLRVLCPKQKGFKPDDLLLEVTMGAPVLQVAAQSFIPGSPGVQLAILLPKKLVIASVVRQSGQAEAGDVFGKVCQLQVHCEHPMEHTAYSFTTGNFGGTSGPHQIAVLSMDGQVSFFDHNKTLFQRYLPATHFLVPGAFQYIPKIDSFLTGSSILTLDCYRYTTFTQSTGSETKEAGQGRKVTVDWSFNVGEDVIDIRECRVTRNLPNHQVDIVVLCEHTLFVLKENGELRFNKRLDVNAAALCTYPLPDGKTDNIIVGTHTGSLMVFTDKTLAWSAKLPRGPLNIRVMTVAGVNGMVVVLDETGMTANYLGTDPANNPVQVLDSKEIDYDAMDEEHRRLQTIMRQAVSSNKAEPKDVLRFNFEPPQGVTPQRTCAAAFYMTYGGTEPLQNVVLTIHTSDPVQPDRSTHTFPILQPGETASIVVNFGLGPSAERICPTSLLVEAVACYNNAQNEALTSKLHFILPLALVGSAVPPVKSVAFKVQLDINKPPPDLRVLFEDLAHGDTQPNIVSFMYCNGADATILVSKNANRLRIQAGTFEALWLITSELTRRLKLFFREEVEPLRIDYTENIPMEEYFACIDNHFQARLDLQASHQALAETAQQFRAIQKRLLVRFRDKNPASLTSLESLFEDTYRKLHVKADAVEAQQANLEIYANILACATHLILLITRYRFQDSFTKEDFDIFRYYLNPQVSQGTGSGWEEITDAGLTHLLRTVLSKNAKESSSVPQPLAIPSDTSKLKKHMTIVFDRISKGFTLRDRKHEVEVVEGRRPRQAAQD